MKPFFSILFIVIAFLNGYAQESNREKHLLIGLNYGEANQGIFPYDNKNSLGTRNYLYRTKYYKLQINYLIAKKNKISYELHIEPSLYFSKHQLLNRWFIKEDAPNFEEQRNRFTKAREFKEYALNCGIMVRYELFKNMSTYALGSVGPMIGEQDTERLKKGFAFSDIFGIGISYKQNKIIFDLRGTLRHNSNADLYMPNHGHNSVGIESGVMFKLK